MQVHGLLRRRAEAVDGAAAFIREEDEDGEIDEWLAAPWDQASDALLFAAMARGAPQYLSAADAEALSRPWRDVFGDPAGPA